MINLNTGHARCVNRCKHAVNQAREGDGVRTTQRRGLVRLVMYECGHGGRLLQAGCSPARPAQPRPTRWIPRAQLSLFRSLFDAEICRRPAPCMEHSGLRAWQRRGGGPAKPLYSPGYAPPPSGHGFEDGALKGPRVSMPWRPSLHSITRCAAAWRRTSGGGPARRVLHTPCRPLSGFLNKFLKVTKTTVA